MNPMVGFTVASRVVHVVLDEPVRVQLRNGRKMAAYRVRIYDGFKRVPFSRFDAGARPGRKVSLLGLNVKRDDSEGLRSVQAWFDPEDPNERDGEMPDWLVRLVEKVMSSAPAV